MYTETIIYTIGILTIILGLLWRMRILRSKKADEDFYIRDKAKRRSQQEQRSGS